MPEPGDPVVCIKCASVNTPDQNQQLRQMTRAELNKLHPETQAEVHRIQQGVFYLKRKRAESN